MIPPEMPTCTAIRQAVLDDDANSKSDDLVRVIGMRCDDVCRVDLEVFITFATIMNGILKQDVDGTTGCGIAEMMDFPFANFVPRCRSLAVGAAAFFWGSGAVFCFRFRQIVGMDDSFGRVGLVLAGSGHGVILLENKLQGDNLPDFPFFVNPNSPIYSLHSLSFLFFVSFVENFIVLL